MANDVAALAIISSVPKLFIPILLEALCPVIKYCVCCAH